jgi:hypothetical protein
VGRIMASRNQHYAVGASASRAAGLRWRLPPMPVVLRIPRIVEEAKESPSSRGVPKQSLGTIGGELPRPRVDFRWPVGVGVAVLMLIVSIPWLIRWHPTSGDSLENLTPTVVAIENDSDIEVLPPLYARTISSSPASLPNLERGGESGSELLESLVAPHPVGGPQ